MIVETPHTVRSRGFERVRQDKAADEHQIRLHDSQHDSTLLIPVM